jgi:hypothetical protein
VLRAVGHGHAAHDERHGSRPEDLRPPANGEDLAISDTWAGGRRVVHRRPPTGGGPDEPLDVGGPDAQNSIVHRDGRESLAAQRPSERPIGQLSEPSRCGQDRDGPIPVAFDFLSKALELGPQALQLSLRGLGASPALAFLGKALGPALSLRLGLACGYRLRPPCARPLRTAHAVASSSGRSHGPVRRGAIRPRLTALGQTTHLAARRSM